MCLEGALFVYFLRVESEKKEEKEKKNGKR